MGSYSFFLQSIFSYLFIIFLLVESVDHKNDNGPVINVTKHIYFPDFSSKNPKIEHELKLLGSAIISPEKGRVQIPDTSQKTDFKQLAGRAIYAFPIRLFDPVTRTPASFETTFSFQFETIPNSSISNSNPTGENDGGSGFSFVIVPDEFTVGRPGPWLGMLNDACDEDYKAVGIEFDTRQNPEFGDPNDNHLGINLGSIVSAVTINVSDFGVNLKDGSVHRAWITYYGGKQRFMDIRLGADNGDFPSKPVFSSQLELSPFLKEYMFVGFSASTGNHTQIHNLISWNFTSTSQASLLVPSADACESKIIMENGGKSSISKTPSSGFFIFMAVVVLVLFALFSIYYNGKRRDRQQKSNEVLMLTDKKRRPRPPNKPRKFSISEVSSATRCFNELQKLGSDERSETYKGTLLNGINVAVKRFSNQFFNSYGLDRRHVAKEIKAIAKIRHPNLVPIRGWCCDHHETMIVYDYIPNGSLENWLFGIGVLPWTRRFKVVKDVAAALSYLHSNQLAHKNLKTSSVFLDVSFRAVVGDFGFVMLLAESKRFESAVSQSADVFEFGVFLLEVVAGKRRSDPDGGGLDLLELAWAMHERDEKVKVVDKRMGSVVNLEQAVRVLEIGLLCTLNESRGRPRMEEAAEFLNLENDVPELPSSRPIALFPYSSTTGLCSAYSCASFK